MAVQPSQVTPDLSRLTITDVMRRDVVTCHPDDGLKLLATSLVDRDVRAIIMPAPGHAPLIVSDIELVRAALDEPAAATAQEVAVEPVATLPSDTPLDQAIARMAELYVAHVLAVDPDTGALAGVLSSFDIAAWIGGTPSGELSVHSVSFGRAPETGRLADTCARSAMQWGVVSCRPDVPITTAARWMAERRVRCVAVAGVGESTPGKPCFEWGLLDDMDVVRAAHRQVLDAPSGSIARNAPVAVSEGDSVQHAARLMVDNDARHVVVVGPTGLPSGMLSTLDVAWLLAGQPVRRRSVAAPSPIATTAKPSTIPTSA